MKKHMKAITSLFTICVMLFTLSVPVFAANKYGGTLHPGSMIADDDTMGTYLNNTYWNTTSGKPPTENNGYKIIAEARIYSPASDTYEITWFYYDPTMELPPVKMDDSGSGFYKVTLPYSYTAILNQKTGVFTRATVMGSQNWNLLFDKPVNPTAGMVGSCPFGIYLPEDSHHVNLLALKWYTTPDLTQLGEDGNLSESDFDLSGLEVKITPSLKVGLTEEDRSYMDDGTEWDKDYFDVMVINNTDTWYQIRIKVVGVDLKNKSYFWYINSQEWNYVDKISESYRVKPFGQLSFVDGQTHTVEKQFGNSEWHIVGGHSAYEQMIQWDDLNLIVGEKYQLIVEAVPAVSKYASNLFVNETLSQDDGTNEKYYTKENQYHAYDHDAQKAMISVAPVKIYVGTFSIQDAIPYNPNNENIYNGTMSNYTPDPGAGKIAAIEDKNGNVYGYGENPPGVDIDIDPSDVSLSDVKNLFGTTKPFLNFMRDAFATFPAFVWILFSGCMMGCIILRILGR